MVGAALIDKGQDGGTVVLPQARQRPPLDNAPVTGRRRLRAAVPGFALEFELPERKQSFHCRIRRRQDFCQLQLLAQRCLRFGRVRNRLRLRDGDGQFFSHGAGRRRLGCGGVRNAPIVHDRQVAGNHDNDGRDAHRRQQPLRPPRKPCRARR